MRTPGRTVTLFFQSFKLHLVIMGIDSIFQQELFVGSPFRDAVFGNHKDFVRIADRGETVGDRDGCTVFSEFFQAFLDSAFAFVVQGAGRLVQDQDGRIFRNTRAMEMRCFCPPERRVPRSPTKVSYPSGSSWINSWIFAFLPPR